MPRGGRVTGHAGHAAKLAFALPHRSARVVFRSSLLRLSVCAAGLVGAVVLTGCGPSNRLREVDLTGRRVAVVAAVPPHPRVQAGSPAEAGINPYDPVGSVLRVGTAIDKRREARRAQTRLDSVVARVDVADRIARSVLVRTADVLRVAPADRPDGADYVLDLRIADYALVADSFEGDTYFVLLGDMLLRDAATGSELWRADIRERNVLDGSIFGLPAAIGNVVTGRALARLTPEQMEAGLLRLADRTAQRVADRLERDYARSRDDYTDRQRRGGQ